MILQAVNQLLRVLKPHPYGNPFRLQLDAGLHQRGIDITRRMPCGENHRAIPLTAVGSDRTCHHTPALTVISRDKPLHSR